MKIVIDIPESTYKVFKNLSRIIGVLVYEKDILTLIKAVKNGTPLSQGHGRLIDADRLREEMEKDVRRAMSFADLTDFVWLAPTIIKADKEDVK